MKGLLHELRTFCASLAGDLRQRRDYGAVLDVEAITDIGRDADQERQVCASLAYKARVADEEGIARLRQALADGKITVDEIPLLRAALRNFENSRRADEALANRLT